MGIAALIIGIVSAILAFIPLCGYIAFIPALVGLALGIVDIVQKSKKNDPKVMGIVGVITNAAAIILIVVWTILFAVAGVTADKDAKDALQKVTEEVKKVEETNK